MILPTILIVTLPIFGILSPVNANSVSVTKDAVKGGLSIEYHTRLTEDTRLILEKFKARVLPKIKKEFMKHDLYLLRFLEAKKFNLDKAELMLLNHLEFREENKMDGIHEEDWSDFEKDYPYRVDGVDKLGRPIVQFDFGKWDVSKAIDSGKQKRLDRYVDKALDEATMKVVKLQSMGKNVTQWVWLWNMMDVNFDKHIGLQSTRSYIEGTNTLENNHPGMSSHILLLNNPEVFAPVMTLVRSAMSADTNEGLKGYGGPEEWKPVLDNFIDQDQLGPEYGGTKGTQKTPGWLAGAYQRRKDGTWWLWHRVFEQFK